MKGMRGRAAAVGLACVMLAGVSFPVQASSGLRAGITAVLGDYLAARTSASKSAGVAPLTAMAMNTMQEISKEAAAREAAALQAEAEAAALAAETAKICGYTNLGVADVESHLNIREGAGEDQKLVGKLPKNGGCEILETAGDWYKIQSGKVTGYVKGEYLLTGEAAAQRANEAKSVVATILGTSVNLRVEPSLDAAVQTSMPQGEEIDVVEELGEWVKVRLDGDICYIYAEYVEVSEQLPKAMTLTEALYGKGVSDVRVALVNYACQFVGNPYVWGGTSLTNGVDCSGFTMKIYAKYGISLPHKASLQATYGKSISSSEARPGDLFFYSSGGSINHVAIYIGNGQVVHASNPKSGIKISNAYYRAPAKVVRLLSD